MIRKERGLSAEKAGFTLIELLVVIAIIGILSSIVLASLSAARSKATVAKLKAQLSGARTAAEIYYDTNNQAYAAGTCAAAPTGMFADAPSGLAQYGDLDNYPGSTMDCGGAAGAYSMAARSADGVVWCVDSLGTSRGTTAAGVTYTALITGATAAHAAAGSTACQ